METRATVTFLVFDLFPYVESVGVGRLSLKRIRVSTGKHRENFSCETGSR